MDLSKKKKVKNMNSKMTTNSVINKRTLKKNQKTKQTTRTGTELQKWRSHGGLLVRRWKGENGGKGTENK